MISGVIWGMCVKVCACDDRVEDEQTLLSVCSSPRPFLYRGWVSRVSRPVEVCLERERVCYNEASCPKLCATIPATLHTGTNYRCQASKKRIVSIAIQPLVLHLSARDQFHMGEMWYEIHSINLWLFKSVSFVDTQFHVTITWIMPLQDFFYPNTYLTHHNHRRSVFSHGKTHAYMNHIVKKTFSDIQVIIVLIIPLTVYLSHH